MNSLDNVTVVGLTGQSGAGKTTVCDVFNKNSFSIINADIIARELTQKGTECLSAISDVFPECINPETYELDRTKMANIVFNDKDMLKLLNSIMYPYITTRVLAEIRRRSNCGESLILLDAPTLFESRTDDFCTIIISVIATEEVRLQRISSRDNISEETIKSRFNSQKDDKFYIDRSDFVIKNDSGLADLTETAKEVSDKIKELYNVKRS